MIITKCKDIAVSALIILMVSLSGGCIKEEFDPAKFDASLDLRSGLAIPIGFSHLEFH